MGRRLKGTAAVLVVGLIALFSAAQLYRESERYKLINNFQQAMTTTLGRMPS